jgi:hypothetical protein
MTTDKEKSLQAVLDKVVDGKKVLGHLLPLKRMRGPGKGHRVT